MIIVRLVSGLGNQLFQYSFARRLSLLKSTPLKLDTSFYDDNKFRKYKLNFFNIESEISTPREIQFILQDNYHGLIKAFLKGKEKLLPYYKRRYIKELKRFIYDPNFWRANENIYVDGYWQNFQYHTLYSEDLDKELTVKSEYLKLARPYLNDINSKTTSVAVHVRRGDYIKDKEANNKFGVLPKSYYDNAIDIIKNKIGLPHLFVFSDEIEWVKENYKFNYHTQYVDFKDKSLDFIELYLMSQCKYSVIANSTFSWWGAFLNKNKNKIIIAPKYWSKLPEINKIIQLQLPDWILL